MKLHSASLAAALGLALALTVPVAMAQDALTERQVQNQLEQQGYKKIHDLKFRDGMWRAQAKSADGRRVTVKVDPRTGEWRCRPPCCVGKSDSSGRALSAERYAASIRRRRGRSIPPHPRSRVKPGFHPRFQSNAKARRAWAYSSMSTATSSPAGMARDSPAPCPHHSLVRSGRPAATAALRSGEVSALVTG